MEGSMRRVWWCLVCLMAQVQVHACLWDTDTLSAERREMPGVLELITGKFVRHSADYYHWRIADRLEKLDASPDDLLLLDDLGVGYDKTGEHDLAIQTARRALNLDPDRYETHANLGTFLIHDRQLKQGLVHIKRAIEINPDAHFGREVIQQYLVEYVSLVWNGTPRRLPLIRVLEEEFTWINRGEVEGSAIPETSQDRLRISRYIRIPAGFGARGFAAYILEQENGNPNAVEEAIRGITGMMRFGHYDSPILLEALADLLTARASTQETHRHLAARAYLKASYSVSDPETKAAYRKLADQVLVPQLRSGSNEELSLEELEARFALERNEAEQWYEGLVLQEASWIQSGVDVDQAFTRHFVEEPPPIHSPERNTFPSSVLEVWNLFFLLILGVPLLVIVVSVVRRSRLKRAAAL